MIATTRLIGQYMVDHADELIVTYCSDMVGDDISIRMIRRKDIARQGDDGEDAPNEKI